MKFLIFFLLIASNATNAVQVLTPPPTLKPTFEPTIVPTTIAPTPILTSYVWNTSLIVSSVSTLQVSSSQSGHILAAVAINLQQAGLPIYLSNNSGVTWILSSSLTSPSNGWSSITVSGNGQYIAANSNNGDGLYISTNLGKSWTNSGIYSLPCFSYSGQYIYAVNGLLYVSTNFGSSFSATSFSYSPNFLTTSSSGQIVYVIYNGLYVASSNNYGATWSYSSNAIFGYTCGSLSTSNSGQYVAAGSYYIDDNNILCYVFAYVSSNYGSSWSTGFYSPPFSCSIFAVPSISMSSSGQYMSMVTGNGLVYLSNTYGVTWYLSKGSPSDSYSVSLSGNGGLIIVGTKSGFVYQGSNNNLYFAPTFASTNTPTSSNPTTIPSFTLTDIPSYNPTFFPSRKPSSVPSPSPSTSPSLIPSTHPSAEPSVYPSKVPSVGPSVLPSGNPSTIPSNKPTINPTVIPSVSPSVIPSKNPNFNPSLLPTTNPSIFPSVIPSTLPTTAKPSSFPTINPSQSTLRPTIEPTTEKPLSMPFSVLTFNPSTVSPTTVSVSSSTSAPSSMVQYNWNINLQVSGSNNIYVSNSRSGQYIVAVSVVAQAGQPIYLSNNSGQSWNMVSSLTSPPNGWGTVTVSGEGKFMAVSTRSGCGPYFSAVYMSSDYGATWAVVSSIPQGCGTILTVKISDSGQYVYVFSSYNSYSNLYYVYQSSNYGQTWSSINSLYGYTAILTISGSGQFIFAWTKYSTYIYVSSNYGSSFKFVPVQVSENSLYANAVIATSQSGQYSILLLGNSVSSPNTYLSSNYGVTWIPQYFSAAQNSYPISIAMSSSGQFVVTTINLIGLYISNNYGMSWYSSSGARNSYSVSINSLGGTIISGATDGFVYVGTSSLTSSPSYVATIKPSNFVQSAPTFVPTVTSTIIVQYNWAVNYITSGANLFVSISKSSGTYLAVVSSAAVAGQSIYLSSNGGTSWVTVSSLTSPVNGWTGIKVSSTGQYMAAITGLGCDSYYSKVYISQNYGSVWTLSTGLPNNCYSYWYVIYSTNGQYVYAIAISGYLGVYKSSNYGSSFSSLTSSTSNFYTAIVTSNSGQNVTAVAGQTIYQSTNFGLTWKAISPGFIYCNQPIALTASVSGQYMVAMSPCTSKNSLYVYTSSNYGNNWVSRATSLPANPIISLTTSSTGQIVAVSLQSNGVYLSADYGSTWTLETGTPLNGFSSISMVGTGSVVLAGTSLGSIYLGKSSSMSLKKVRSGVSKTKLRPPEFAVPTEKEQRTEMSSYNISMNKYLMMSLFSLLCVGIFVLVAAKDE